MLRFVVALLLAVACSADLVELTAKTFNHCTICNLHTALQSHPNLRKNLLPGIPDAQLNCEDVCVNQEEPCKALMLAVQEYVTAEPEDKEIMEQLYDIAAPIVDPVTHCGKRPVPKHGQRLFLGLDSTVGCKVCGIGTGFICNTFFTGDTEQFIYNATATGVTKLCTMMKIPKLVEKIKILGDFDVCAAFGEYVITLIKNYVKIWFCDKEKTQMICGAMFEGCKL